MRAEAATSLRLGFVDNPYIAEILCGNPDPMPLPIWEGSNWQGAETAKEYVGEYGELWRRTADALEFLRWLHTQWPGLLVFGTEAASLHKIQIFQARFIQEVLWETSGFGKTVAQIPSRHTTTGLIVYFDESRRADLIRDKPIEEEGFSDTLSVSDWPFKQVSVALLGFTESTIDYICLARKGRRVATLKNRIEFFEIISLNGIEVSAIARAVSQKLRQYFINISVGTGGVIPHATWAEVIAAVKAERPSLTAKIDHLLALQHYSGTRWTGRVATLFSEERDALGVSLDIFSRTSKLRGQVLSSWVPPEEA